MIERIDLKAIDIDYFDIVEAREYLVVLHSKSTGHDWCLLEREANGYRTFLISHRHRSSYPYHPHKSQPTIKACCEYIMDHDAFHLEREKKKNARRLQHRAVKH